MINQLNNKPTPRPHLSSDQDFSSASSPQGQPRSITAEFLNRDAVSVARDLIGATIISSIAGKTIRAMITETAAYPDKNDRDTHSYKTLKGLVPPERKPGSLYVYNVQATHSMLTVATPPYNEGGCVLIRAICLEDSDKIEGPGKVSKALGIDASFNGQNILQECGIRIEKRADGSSINVEQLSRGKSSKAPELLYRFKMKE
jgi:DNA-3-methyladenine glycosylase